MRVHQWLYPEGAPDTIDASVSWVLCFGDSASYQAAWPALHRTYPKAVIGGCTTAGGIAGETVDDFPLVVTAIGLEASRVLARSAPLAEPGQSAAAGAALAAALPGAGLSHVLLLSDGLRVNGTELVRGLLAGLPAGVRVTGGMAGDGTRFAHTAVFLDEACLDGAVVAFGLYGERLRIGHGSLGGWDPFGPERLITRAQGNVLFELDGQPALGLYKRYLGEHAEDLPASGLLFPLCLRGGGDDGVVRTILAVNEAEGSMTFAGDMPVGAYARLMRANFDRLVEGAAGAAAQCQGLAGAPAELALLISCVGRRLVLRQRVEDELEAVRAVLGPGPVLAGFYSYGEFSPLLASAGCSLHNQTMTITTLAET